MPTVGGQIVAGLTDVRKNKVPGKPIRNRSYRFAEHL